MLKYVDKNGQKRKGIEVKCRFCSNAFVTRADQPAKYCSRSCGYEDKKRRVQLECAQCGKSFDRKIRHTKGSKSGLFFCTRTCKDEAQKLGGIKEIQPPHFGTASGEPRISIYRAKFTEDDLACSRCGYKEFSSCVEIHHLDHDRSNNEKSNLIPLCCNCHQAYHRGRIDKTEIKDLL